MSDKTFEISLTALSILMVAWMVVASIFLFSAIWAIIIGLLVWIIGGGALLFYWGRSYMSRL